MSTPSVWMGKKFCKWYLNGSKHLKQIQSRPFLTPIFIWVGNDASFSISSFGCKTVKNTVKDSCGTSKVVKHIRSSRDNGFYLSCNRYFRSWCEVAKHWSGEIIKLDLHFSCNGKFVKYPTKYCLTASFNLLSEKPDPLSRSGGGSV